ncbi:IS66 family insertion sequence element accessory protein TnpB [Frigidibacter mobilis]|uniref:Transposase, IS66 Orf2 like protein n=1 Tax=Frigidibacter mobilis TaxID=1335048 RepID=A0A165SSY5_9RHOB|nr:IS66 family insertion sequence element accessory protein TnpB [Frigidibacter mobilis]AMY70288.1 transposase, IS66 Orf2 like protein [Frigidibacter mobilis]AMY70544.1 transposase, IS66 Orf2 like protein [Frigidibacter mobilis]AMY70733.1 transposase, IS66 Orf2 like protein [Frigidibacter mobilis]
MFSHGGPVKVYVATRPVDFRKGIDGLALAVQEMFGLDPFCGAVFVFRSKRADRIKLLVWDQTGMVLVHKRLEDARFVWPQVQGGVMRMSSAQLAALFEGWTGGWSGRNARGVRWWLDDWQNALKSLFLLACKGIP